MKGLVGNLSNCLINLKNSGDSTGFEPMHDLCDAGAVLQRALHRHRIFQV